MCIGNDCGTFRVYEISEIKVEKWWYQEHSAPGAGHRPPPGGTLTAALVKDKASGLGSVHRANEAIAKFEQGLRRRWNTPVHGGDKCEGNCDCVQTEEEVGKPSLPVKRTWRQPMSLAGHDPIVVMGSYIRKFRDFKGKCDLSDEFGEPINWETEEIAEEEM